MNRIMKQAQHQMSTMPIPMPEYDTLVTRAQANNDLLDSITTFLGGVAAIITKSVAQATTLEQLKTSMTALAAVMQAKDDAAAAALVAATPAAAVTPPATA
jgi:hypothetical protein